MPISFYAATKRNCSEIVVGIGGTGQDGGNVEVEIIYVGKINISC
jgi:hypothetical protein